MSNYYNTSHNEASSELQGSILWGILGSVTGMSVSWMWMTGGIYDVHYGLKILDKGDVEEWKLNIPVGKQEGEAFQIKRKVGMAGYWESHV